VKESRQIIIISFIEIIFRIFFFLRKKNNKRVMQIDIKIEIKDLKSNISKESKIFIQNCAINSNELIVKKKKYININLQ
jgi:hypothetical protein